MILFSTKLKEINTFYIWIQQARKEVPCQQKDPGETCNISMSQLETDYEINNSTNDKHSHKRIKLPYKLLVKLTCHPSLTCIEGTSSKYHQHLANVEV